MIAGFDLNSPLVCEGIIGDGCGGGRIFYMESETLFAYDPMSKGKIILLSGLKNVQKISKSACIITILSEEGELAFDLSQMHQQ